MDPLFFDCLTNGPYDWVQGKYVKHMNAGERADWDRRQREREQIPEWKHCEREKVRRLKRIDP